MSDVTKIPVTQALRNDYDLLHRLVAVTAIDWIVVLTNPNCEARAMNSLRSKGFIAYQPLEPIARNRSRQKRTSIDASRPFFPRYVFVGLDRTAGQSSNVVRACDGVEKILTFRADQFPHIVPARHMQTIMEAAWQAQTDKKYVVSQMFEVGEGIRFTTFAFSGFTGFVTAYDEAKELVSAEVSIFGRATPVTVPVDNVERLNK